MFRDGIFESFSDFLNSINESTLKEDILDMARQLADHLRNEGYMVDKDTIISIEEGLRQLPEDRMEDVDHLIRFFRIEDFNSLFPGLVDELTRETDEYGDPIESKLSETDRKKAPQTMEPQQKTRDDVAKALSMEDWSEEDNKGEPKRKDKVEYPSKLREPEEKEFEQEVQYERRTDPLYLCNECFKTFRANQPICKCGSKVVERIGKIKEMEEEDLQTKVLFAYDKAREAGKSREEAVRRATKVSKGKMTAPEVRKMLDIKSVDTAEIPEEPKESKIKENSDIPLYKSVYSVQYNINGTTEEDRVEAFDEEDAKRMVLKKKPDAKDPKATKVGESKVNEASWWERLLSELRSDEKFKSLVEEYGKGSDQVFDYFAKKYWSVSASRSSIEAALKDALKEIDIEESKTNEADVKQITPGEYIVTFYDGGHKKIEADSKVDAMKQARETYPEKRVSNVELYKETGGTALVDPDAPKPDWRKESKIKEQDENGYTTVAKGIEDENTARDVARDKGGQVIADSEDPDKFAVIVKEE